MLDHAFLAAVEILRRSFNDAMLDHQPVEERIQSDLIGGDLTWETSYALPGEGRPPRVRADVTVDWPTWSQTALRSWRLEGELDEPPNSASRSCCGSNNWRRNPTSTPSGWPSPRTAPISAPSGCAEPRRPSSRCSTRT